MWWGERDPGDRVTHFDRLLLLALAAYEADVCECGHPRSESMSWEHDPRNPEHTARYVAGAPFECLACGEMARAQAAYSKALGQENQEHMAAMKWVAELVPRGYRPA